MATLLITPLIDDRDPAASPPRVPSSAR